MVAVWADPRRLRQVLVNLIDTAIASMDEGNIRLWCQVDPITAKTHILVEDERPISAWKESLHPETHPTATVPTAMGNPPLSLGMTLAVNQSLMELMDGRLEVLSLSSDLSSPTPDIFASSESQGIMSSAFPLPLTRIQCSLPTVLPD
jgi:C4-dicarboxylate-specific signal transduction histidine kinase